GAMRTTKRLSSRIATLASNAGGMTIAGLLFGAAQAWLMAHGVAHGAAHLAALALSAVAYLVASTVALMQIVYLKRGLRLTFKEWFDSTSWVGTVYLVCAVFAALLSLNAQ